MRFEAKTFSPRAAIARRVQLMRCALTDAPRRGEREEDWEIRIALELDRLARRIIDDAVRMRGAEPTPWTQPAVGQSPIGTASPAVGEADRHSSPHQETPPP
jgi:hypothetical protein